ncbi:Bypass of stop codon protein 6 [Diplodia seriata]|uniref:Bypass of stop codon protein 6 n=1 Tax=Diplodia seriata TaxID=420778 RepID=A0A1S8BMM3_9PEZI|nr:Bypass of stop codon protein 6 [Diplodia seriata]
MPRSVTQDRLSSGDDAVELANIAQPAEAEWEPTTPKATYIKVVSAAFSFFVAGVNDGSLGALIPYLIRSYDINTAMISIVYAVTFSGWFFAAISNSHLSQYLDLGAMLVLGAFLQVLAHALRCWTPPFALFAVTFGIASLGQAYQDTHANTFVASVKGAHRFLGLIHAMYSGGCLVGPFVSTAIASADTPSRWSLFYTFPLGLGVMNLILCVIAFWDSLAIKAKRPGNTESGEGSRNEGALLQIKETLKTPSVWLLSLFYFFYLGAVITASGWVVEYLVEVRDGNLADMGYVPAGFNGGSFLGRLLLAEPTHRWGERRMLFIYSVIGVALQLLFWLYVSMTPSQTVSDNRAAISVPNIVAASVAISLLGFVLGPFFAAGISVGSRLFSAQVRSSALALVFVLGQIGGSIFPAITGIVAAHAGVKVLQPVLVALLAATGVSWLLVPKTSGLHHRD